MLKKVKILKTLEEPYGQTTDYLVLATVRKHGFNGIRIIRVTGMYLTSKYSFADTRPLLVLNSQKSVFIVMCFSDHQSIEVI